jgi:hypothetical protein
MVWKRQVPENLEVSALNIGKNIKEIIKLKGPNKTKKLNFTETVSQGQGQLSTTHHLITVK